MNRRSLWGDVARLAAWGVFFTMCSRVPAQAPAAGSAPAAPGAAFAESPATAAPAPAAPAAPADGAAPPPPPAPADGAAPAPAPAEAAAAAPGEKTVEAYAGELRKLLAQKKYDELLTLISVVEVKFPGEQTVGFYRTRAEEEKKSLLNRGVPRVTYNKAERAAKEGAPAAAGSEAAAAPAPVAAHKPADISPMPKAATLGTPDVKARKGASKPVFVILGAFIVAGMVFLSVFLMWRKRAGRGLRDEDTQTDFGYDTTDGGYGQDVAIQPPGYSPLGGGDSGFANGMAGDFAADPLFASADPFGGFGTPQGGFEADPFAAPSAFSASAHGAGFDNFGGPTTATAPRPVGEPEPILSDTAEDLFGMSSSPAPKKSAPAPVAAPADEPFSLFNAFEAPSAPKVAGRAPAPADNFDPMSFGFDAPSPAASAVGSGPSLLDEDLPTIALDSGPPASLFSPSPPVHAPSFSAPPPAARNFDFPPMGAPPISAPTFSSAPPPSSRSVSGGADAPFVSPFGGSKQPESDETMVNFDAFMAGPGPSFPPASGPSTNMDLPMLSSMPGGDETMITPVGGGWRGGFDSSEPMNLDSTVVLSARELSLDPDLMVKKKAQEIQTLAGDETMGGPALDLSGGGGGGDAFEHQKSLGLQAIRDAQWDAAVKHLALAASLRPEAMDVKEQLRRARRMRKTE